MIDPQNADSNALIEALRQQISDARLTFRGECRVLLDKAQRDADAIAAAIGEVSVDEARQAWVMNMLNALREFSRAKDVS